MEVTRGMVPPVSNIARGRTRKMKGVGWWRLSPTRSAPAAINRVERVEEQRISGRRWVHSGGVRRAYYGKQLAWQEHDREGEKRSGSILTTQQSPGSAWTSRRGNKAAD